MKLYNLIKTLLCLCRYNSLYLQSHIAMYATSQIVTFGDTSTVIIEKTYQRNKMKVSDMLVEIPDIGVNACAAECLSYADCQSVNYNMEAYACELNSEISNDIDERKDEYIHITKTQLRTNSQGCSKHCNLTCSARQKCINSTTGKDTCVYIYCEEPRQLNQGDFKKISNERFVGSTAEYDCKRDYGAYGPMSSTCSTDGKWTAIGECLRCSPVPVLENAKADTSKRAYGTVVTYSCQKCFKRVGAISTECQVNETWTPINGYCRATSLACSRTLPNITNAVPQGNYNTTCGSVASFICNYGYLGPVYAVCAETGKWVAHGKCKAYCIENYFEEVDVDGELLKLCWQVFPSESKTYDRATEACQSKAPNGRLIVLDTVEKQTLVRQRLMSSLKTASTVFWVNGRFDGTGYFFTNGVACSGNWMNEQPDRSGNCLVAVRGNFSWDDRNCFKTYPIICEADIS